MVGRPISLPLQFGLAFRAIQGYVGFRVEGLGYRVQGYTGFRHILLYDNNGETWAKPDGSCHGNWNAMKGDQQLPTIAVAKFHIPVILAQVHGDGFGFRV